ANVRSYAPVRARLVREPYRRIRKTSGYAGGYLLSLAGNIKRKTYPVISFIYKNEIEIKIWHGLHGRWRMH
ncbi:hypothetical protein KXS51_15100, partial [Salmonella enterica subsp. enterica serovar Weltevreden]|nr:hypothetical protein [Salmonella enterica subsp. enterica serovar Weltevreden]